MLTTLISSCGYNNRTDKKTGIVFHRLIPFFVLLVPYFCLAQQKISADVTTRQLTNGKVLRIEKQLYYTSNGNLVVHFSYPQEYYVVTNSLGESFVYQPKANEVMITADKSFSSTNEIFSSFSSSAKNDLNLTEQGFKLSKTVKDGKDIVKIFVPKDSKQIKNISKIEVVLRNNQPIYSAVYDNKGKINKKSYFSQYFSHNKFSFPTLITQISYNSQTDSIITKEVYSNIRTNNFPNNALFDFKIPNNAKRVNPYSLKK